MDIFQTSLELDYTITIRLLFSLLLGFALGFEREITGKFAGLRTHILVCVGATVFTLLSIYGFKFVTAEGTIGINDPARVAAQIITGIGFIGAGTVMRQGTNIYGITTAATLWMSAAVGMACGCGLFFLACTATFITLTALVAVGRLERKFLLNKISHAKNIEISFSCPIENFETIYKIVEDNFTVIGKIKKKIVHGKDFSTKLIVATKKPISKINELFKNSENVFSLEISEVRD